MQNNITSAISDYVRNNGIQISFLAKKTGINPKVLYNSIGNGGRLRPLRADEFLSICLALGCDPWIFATTDTKAS